MIRLAVPILLLAGLTAADAAQRRPDLAAARIEKQLSGLAPGEARRCLAREQWTQMLTARGVILYVAGRDRAWRNDVVGHCDGLARGDLVVTRSLGSDLCEGDIVRTRSRSGGMLTGSCSLGKFVSYVREK